PFLPRSAPCFAWNDLLHAPGRRGRLPATCGRGGIGRRAALRSLWGNPWKFESSRPHHPPACNHQEPRAVGEFVRAHGGVRHAPTTFALVCPTCFPQPRDRVRQGRESVGRRESMSNHMFDAIRAAVPSRDATLLTAPAGRQWTYGDMLDFTARLAARLAALGVGPEDRVAAQVEKSPEALML